MKRVGPENHVCELNNSTDERHNGDLVENFSYLYHEAKVRKCNATENSSGNQILGNTAMDLSGKIEVAKMAVVKTIELESLKMEQ